MKADWNDAPGYLKRPRKRGAAKLIPALIGTLITLGLLQMASSAFLKGTVQDIVDKRTRPKPTPVAEIRRAEPAATKDWDRVVEEVAARGATPQPHTAQPTPATAEPLSKQTVFNDKNYIPQGATNIVPATRAIPEQIVTTPSRQKEIVVVGKERRISDFCQGGEGSIDRRNCKATINLNTRN
ncbi:hypothetical protein [Stutzerimonas degradans]|uniref:hypothetical protein n=1 Tax=Stutzerimonas degradans TaxID=2968968 RepID=UPI0013F4D613|nr:hypothetical protein [Stutzerimonas degradans]NHC09782.1 hypothetical protein [Stutzerimonas degradans]